MHFKVEKTNIKNNLYFYIELYRGSLQFVIMQKIKINDLISNYRFNEKLKRIYLFLEIISGVDLTKFKEDESYFTLQGNESSDEGFLLKLVSADQLNCSLTFELSTVYQSLFIAFDDEKLVEFMYSNVNLEVGIDVVLQVLKSPIELITETNASKQVINKIYEILHMNDQEFKFRKIQSIKNNKEKLIRTVQVYESWI